ncbi:MAG: hypothetical protein ABI165_02475 [Bryobacteraceae bacterium]
MTAAALLLLLMAAQPGRPDAQALTKAVAASGRVLTLALTPSRRLRPPARIAPGAPPLLSFRLFESTMRHRSGKLDLVIDDAGH